MRWNVDEAIQAARALRPCSLVWLEEPTIPDDVHGHARISREGGVPIATGENKMYLEPGDLQILNSHVNLHARTDFVDHQEPSQRRLLFRMWLATPDSVELPESWRPGYVEVAAGAVRGGILGQAYDDRRKAFDRRQAIAIGMKQIP